MRQCDPVAQNPTLQFSEERIGQRRFALPGASGHHIRESLDSCRPLGLILDGEARLAFPQRHLRGRTHQQVLAELRGQVPQ
jgi:hypothetical protein